MTVKEFDDLLRSALLEAQDESWRSTMEGGPDLCWIPSRRKTMDRLYRDPFGYGKQRARPLWRRTLIRAARAAACLLLAGTVVLTVSPKARALGQTFLRQWFPEYTDYIFRSEQPGEAARWRPAYLPEGYTLTDTFEVALGVGDLTYEDESGHRLYFCYQTAMIGAGFGIDNEHSDLTIAWVNGIPADLYISNTEDRPHHLIWSTPDEQAAFHLMAYDLPVEELIRMAESVEITE